MGISQGLRFGIGRRFDLDLNMEREDGGILQRQGFGKWIYYGIRILFLEGLESN